MAKTISSASFETGQEQPMRPKIVFQDECKEFITPERCWIIDNENDAANSDCSIARARVEPGVTTQWHMLTDTNERYLIVGGNGVVEVEGLGKHMVQAGDIVRIPANTAQRITNRGDIDLVFYCICTPRFEAHCYVAREELEDRVG
jgi:mannose-6-phosphate isomerase-like protein (cupin superfamily)